MNGILSNRLQLIDRLQRAEKQHAPRAHIRRDLIDVTTKQLRLETRRWSPSRIAACVVIALLSAVYIVSVLHLSGVMK